MAWALPLPAAAQTIYKWVDEKGVTHFSQTPPPGDRKATTVTPKVTPPSADAKPAPGWRERELESRKLRIERSQAEDAARARSHNEAAQRTNLCNEARRELHVVGRAVPVYYLNEKGERVYLEDHERAAAAEHWRRQVEAHCDRR